MFGMGFLRKKETTPEGPNEETLQAIFDLVDKSSVALSGNAIYGITHLDSTDIDECLQKLVSKGWLEVAYEKTGLDHISRSYYRVSERYNLMDVKEQVSSFIANIVRKAKPLVQNDHLYHVRVIDQKRFNATFDVREQAREYKRLLKSSRMNLKSEIWEAIFEDGVQVREQKIS